MDETQSESRYFDGVKACTMISGIWPFDDDKAKHIKRFMWYILCTAGFTYQFARIIKFCSFDTVVEQTPFVCVGMLAFVKHLNFVIKEPKFAKILRDVSKDWSSESTEEEMLITHTYAERALLYAFLYKLSLWSLCVMFWCKPLLPHILDVVQPLNESRPRLFIYPGYYFVDPDTHYYYIVGFTVLALFVVTSIVVGIDMIMIYIVQYICGSLILAGHRFKNAVDTVSVSSKGYVLSSDTAYRKLCISIQSHNKAIQTIYDLESANLSCTFVQVGVVMVGFSITLVMVAAREFSLDLCLQYIFIAVQIIHILFLTIQGQFVINSHDDVYSMIYDAPWFDQASRTQALYVLALRRCLTPPVLTAGGLIPLNLNTFAEIVKASVSYFTVLKSS